MNKIGISGSLAAGAHVRGDLSAMIGRVHDYVGQDVDNRARPLLSLTVLVGDGLGDVPGSDQIEKREPETSQLRRLSLTLRQIGLRPYRNALRLLFQPLQPDPLGRKNMGHELQRSMIDGTVARAARSSDRVQDFSVRPLVVGKLAAQIVSKIHEQPPSHGSLATPPM